MKDVGGDGSTNRRMRFCRFSYGEAVEVCMEYDKQTVARYYLAICEHVDNILLYFELFISSSNESWLLCLYLSFWTSHQRFDFYPKEVGKSLYIAPILFYASKMLYTSPTIFLAELLAMPFPIPSRSHSLKFSLSLIFLMTEESKLPPYA